MTDLLDTPATVDASPAVDPPRATGRRGLVVSMVVTGVVVAAARWAFSGDRKVFHVSPDEPSQLAIARWLAGERRWNMFDHATWQPGLGTLLTPIYWFTDDGETAVRWALATNAAIAGISAAVLVLLTRRLTSLPALWCGVVAALAAAAPASLSASSFVWAEPLVSLSFVLTIVLLIRWYDTGALVTGVAAIAVSVGGFTSHSRLLPLVATTVALTVGAALWRRRWAHTAVLAAASALLFFGSAAWTRWILANVWDDPSDQNTVGAVRDRIDRPLDVAEALLGQVWYQLAATVGVAMIGAFVIGRSALRSRHTDPFERLRTIDARIVVVSTLPMIGLSAVFMSGRSRPDQFIYGRYNDAIVWPIIVVGLAWIGRRATGGFERRHLALAAVTAAMILGLGFAVDQLHGDAIRERYGVRGMIAGLLAFVDGDNTLDVWRTSLIATALFAGTIGVAALAGAPRLPRRASRAVLGIGAAAALLVLGVAVVRTEDVADLRLNGWTAAAQVATVDDLVPPGLPLGVRPVPNSRDPIVEFVPQRQRFQLYQLYLPQRSFVRDRGVDDDVGPYVFAPLQDPDMLEAGATVVWRDPSISIALWLEPTDD